MPCVHHHMAPPSSHRCFAGVQAGCWLPLDDELWCHVHNVEAAVQHMCSYCCCNAHRNAVKPAVSAAGEASPAAADSALHNKGWSQQLALGQQLAMSLQLAMTLAAQEAAVLPASAAGVSDAAAQVAPSTAIQASRRSSRKPAQYDGQKKRWEALGQ